MSDLRTAAQQALDALYRWHMTDGETAELMPAFEALRAALAEPVQEPNDMVEQLADALDSVQFYRRRCEALQSWQSKMRDPERTIVCDILANGRTLDPAVAGDRYTAPPQRKPLTEEEIRRIKPVSPDLVDFRSGVRCAERAHGIGGSDD